MPTFLCFLFLALVSTSSGCEVRMVTPKNGDNLELYKPNTLLFDIENCSIPIDYLSLTISGKEYVVKNTSSFVIDVYDKTVQQQEVIIKIPNIDVDDIIAEGLSMNANMDYNDEEKYIEATQVYLKNLQTGNVKINVILKDTSCSSDINCISSNCRWNGYKCIPKYMDDKCSNSYNDVLFILNNTVTTLTMTGTIGIITPSVIILLMAILMVLFMVLYCIQKRKNAKIVSVPLAVPVKLEKENELRDTTWINKREIINN